MSVMFRIIEDIAFFMQTFWGQLAYEGESNRGHSLKYSVDLMRKVLSVS